MPAFAAEAPIYAAPGAWVVPNTAPLTDGPDARPWLLADRQVLIEGDKRSTFTDSAFRIASADMLRNWSDMRFEWQPDRDDLIRSEEHTSELQSLMRISYAVFCLQKKINTTQAT